MKIELLEISGFRSCLESLRLPYSKECRSKTYSTSTYNDGIGFANIHYRAGVDDFDPQDLYLMSTLVSRGDCHAKPLRGILVYVKITAPIHWWWDIETYRMGHERLFSESTMHTEGKGLSGEGLAEELHKIPFDRQITKVDYFSYQCLRNIYLNRKNHRKKEFQEFCRWIEMLPFARDLITVQNSENPQYVLSYVYDDCESQVDVQTEFYNTKSECEKRRADLASNFKKTHEDSDLYEDSYADNERFTIYTKDGDFGLQVFIKRIKHEN